MRNDLARLCGAPASCRPWRPRRASRLSEVVIKQITGGDRITARFLYGEHFEFKPAFKLFLAANHKPSIHNQDHGIWRRISLIPFDVRIPKEQQDRSLPDKLRQESPGVLAWAVQGCLAWRRGGLREPEEVREATDEYQTEMDPVGDFIAARCEKDSSASAPSSELYRDYVAWAAGNGEKVMTATSFGHRLTERGFKPCKIGKERTRGWAGLRVVGAATLDDGG